jgi:hypothetical protein
MYFVYIVAPLVVALLGTWLSPLPKMIKDHFTTKAVSSPSSVLIAIRKSDYPCGGMWVVRKPPSAIPKPPSSSSSDWGPWVKATGAVDVGSTYATVTIQARPGQVAYITGIHFKILKRKPPIHGTQVSMGCGGPVQGKFVEADLDNVPPRVVETSSDPTAAVGQTPDNFAPFKLPYEVSNTDGLVLIVYGEVKKCDCIWTADILWSSNGRNGSTRIDNNGVPFETTPFGFQAATMDILPSN